jgi:hypothetical protein
MDPITMVVLSVASLLVLDMAAVGLRGPRSTSHRRRSH